MKITCLISLVHTANKTKLYDPPEAHNAIIYPTGSPLCRKKKRQFIQLKIQRHLKITASTQQSLVGFSPTDVSQIQNVCKEFYELQMLCPHIVDILLVGGS